MVMNTRFITALIEGKKKYGIALIAEIKKASPSAGILNSTVEVVDLAQIYASSGAAAVSVLTQPYGFNGSLEDLQRVSNAVSIPKLRKDFITQENQIDEAKKCGAAAVLLIVRMLSEKRLHKLFDYAAAVGLEVLVETHTQEEVTRALGVGATIIGVNARNLETLVVDKTIFEKLLPLIPSNCIKVAESGIESRSDVQYAIKYGADAVLVGSALMKSQNPGEKIKELIKLGDNENRGDSL